MANWLHQLQSLLGQQGASPSGESSKGSGLLPGAIGGLAGLLVAAGGGVRGLAAGGGRGVSGYEILRGETRPEAGCPPLLQLHKAGQAVDDGAISDDGLAFGAYLHG
ncbi:hypothetical protein GTU50_17775, partial [Klebsiella pneumoniae]|nr:hypothetical protein [Klebsiella pneumoniae]